LFSESSLESAAVDENIASLDFGVKFAKLQALSERAAGWTGPQQAAS